MKTVLETLQSGAGYLEKHGVESGRLQMENLLAHVLDCERLQLYLDFDRPLEEKELDPLRELTRRRSEGEPLQHLLGMVEFHGREFGCDSRALVPRPETEELVEKLLARGVRGDLRLLDMGSGSGVIGLSLAAELPQAQVVLCDISKEALELARENAGRLQLPLERLDFVEGDLFAGVEGVFDLVAANLPYIAEEQRHDLSREVGHDPEGALFGGESGTEIMERFIAQLPAHTVAGGALAMEIGTGQAPRLVDALERAGFSEVETAIDISGIERFLFATKEG
ncbi:MAG: peptide chain release factor N(5)-glutamine methyltransferase [Verrucomicrobiales bacterium]